MAVIPGWLAREMGREGRHLITSRPPTLTPLDWPEAPPQVFVTPGDSLGLRHFCSVMVQAAFGSTVPPGWMVPVEMEFRVVGPPQPVPPWAPFPSS